MAGELILVALVEILRYRLEAGLALDVADEENAHASGYHFVRCHLKALGNAALGRLVTVRSFAVRVRVSQEPAFLGQGFVDT